VEANDGLVCDLLTGHPDNRLTDAQVRELSQQVDALAEPLSEVAAVSG
jgi:iron uptake system EfeUOB component EfeO/EfeM